MLPFHKSAAKDSSLIKDFLAGVEPTGVYTFENARTNKKNHGLHKAVGDVGGFLGGAAISTALGAAGTYGIGKLMRKSNLGKYLVEGAKDQMLLFAPHKAVRHIKNLPRATKVMHKAEGMNRAMNSVHRGKNPDNKAVSGLLDKANAYLEESASYAKSTGGEAADTFRKGLAITGGAAAGVLGGGLNALSAHAQYDAGLKQNIYKKKLNKTSSLSSLQFHKSAERNEALNAAAVGAASVGVGLVPFLRGPEAGLAAKLAPKGKKKDAFAKSLSYGAIGASLPFLYYGAKRLKSFPFPQRRFTDVTNNARMKKALEGIHMDAVKAHVFGALTGGVGSSIGYLQAINKQSPSL